MGSVVSLGEEHNAQSGADGPGWQVRGEPGQYLSVVAVGRGDPAPDGLEPVGLAARRLEHVHNTLAEIPLSGVAVVDALQLEDSLVLVLLNLGSPEAEELGSDPQPNWLASTLFDLL